MKKQYKVTLELYDNSVQYVEFGPALTNILYTQGDAETMPLTIHLTTDYGMQFEPDPGALATLNFVAGTRRWPREVAFQSDGTLLYEVQPEDIAIDGAVAVSVTVTAGEEALTWQGFTFNVAESLAIGQTEPPDPYKDLIAAMMHEIEELTKRVDELEAGGTTPAIPNLWDDAGIWNDADIWRDYEVA